MKSGASRQYTLDGEVVDILDFMLVNDMDIEETNEIWALDVGDEIVYGGGAAPEAVLRREE